MARFQDYAPDQAWLLPPRISDELGEEHLACFLHEAVERMDLSRFEAAYSDDGRPAYPPELMLKVWLYAYALGVTSSRKLEQRIREDLGFRFLAGSLKPDHWTLNEFRRRHGRELNNVFTPVVETARGLGLGRLGRVAIDSTRVEAKASPDRSAIPLSNYVASGLAGGNEAGVGNNNAIVTKSLAAVLRRHQLIGDGGSNRYRGS